ncbi:hypothetical protein CWI80_01375 [Pseudidiomarina sediminum]|uniref:Uncharacterized protein n=1 Tax=Pseudidiomarina sediminum TaxID=431675 RepID=A0A432Z871_9GAMM|nr:hypothetical protein [Pseudidiomarina sediminum]MBY6063195.1 hypothetical protein [Pseudidiomarina sediminum]RUO74041.1 hypothetical protein CWI80_01375 [Pseudidiomarina sediminum]
MWLCSQSPWRWLPIAASVWAIEPEHFTLRRLDHYHATVLGAPHWIFITPWWVAIYFRRVEGNGQPQPPRWWLCCHAWTDGLSFARCRRMALVWRQQRR